MGKGKKARLPLEEYYTVDYPMPWEDELEYLNSAALAALPGVIQVVGMVDGGGDGHRPYIPAKFRTSYGIDIGTACYDIAWSMLKARRAERKAWEEEG